MINQLLALVFTARRKRQAVKVVSVVLAMAGLVMVLNKFVSDQIFKQIENGAFNSSTVGELQKALTVFLNHAENQLVKVDLWFGLGYLLLALGLIVSLVITRQRGLRMPKPLQAAVPVEDKPERVSKPKTPAEPVAKPPRRPRPPRLIQ